MRRTTVLGGITALALLALSSDAPAQTGADDTKLTVRATVIPNKAGTPRRPQPVRLRVRVNWDHPPGVERPVVSSAVVWFPRGSRYNGGRHARCSKRTLSRRGVAGCPKRSVMGRATGLAWADRVPTRPRIVIVNGGPRRVWLYTTLYRPALVREPVPMAIARVRGRFAYRARIVVPRALQVVAGVPVAIESFRSVAGRGNWLTTTGCPRNRRWPFRVRTNFLGGGFAEDRSTIRCRR